MSSSSWQDVETISVSSVVPSQCPDAGNRGVAGLQPRTIPELLLILEVVRYLKRHAEVAGRSANSSSLAVLKCLCVAATGDALAGGRHKAGRLIVALASAADPSSVRCQATCSSRADIQPQPVELNSLYACTQGPT
jgi:hypothetical protein